MSGQLTPDETRILNECPSSGSNESERNVRAVAEKLQIDYAEVLRIVDGLMNDGLVLWDSTTSIKRTQKGDQAVATLGISEIEIVKGCKPSHYDFGIWMSDLADRLRRGSGYADFQEQVKSLVELGFIEILENGSLRRAKKGDELAAKPLTIISGPAAQMLEVILGPPTDELPEGVTKKTI